MIETVEQGGGKRRCAWVASCPDVCTDYHDTE